MRLLTTIGLLICISRIYSRSLTSNSILDQLYTKETKDNQITIPFKDRLFGTLLDLQKKFYKAVKSPEGYRAPNICVWKICSKPLKKNKHEKNNKRPKIPSRSDRQRINDIVKAGVLLNQFASIWRLNWRSYFN